MPLNEVETNQVSEIKASGIGPGDRLQAARIEGGLSIDDIASRMHLSKSILEAIEENNFDEITAPIFVKGYLRAYARIVSLDEEEMIQQYVDFYSYEDPPINSTSNTSPEISSDDARIKWTTYVVIFVLCGLLEAWWWNKNQEQNADDVVSLDAEQTQTDVEPTNESLQPEIVESSEKTVETIIAATTVDDSQESAEAELVEPEMAAVVESELESEPELPTISEATVESDVVPETSSSTSSTGSDRLEITINADTWVDIKDATGQKLAYDLLRADHQLVLTGQAPFTVFFGNGHGVEVMFNGEEVDLSSNTRDDNTARLKIGSN